jgi:hypothetical protein
VVIIVVLILLLIFGFAKVAFKLYKTSKRFDETNDYLSRYNSFLSKGRFDMEDYNW